MSEEDWKTGFAKSLAVFLSGQAPGLIDARGEPLIDDDFYIAFNAHYEDIPFNLPATLKGSFRIILNAAESAPVKPMARPSAGTVLPTDATAANIPSEPCLTAGDQFNVNARSVLILSAPCQSQS
jgi:glycogen operon protein